MSLESFLILKIVLIFSNNTRSCRPFFKMRMTRPFISCEHLMSTKPTFFRPTPFSSTQSFLLFTKSISILILFRGSSAVFIIHSSRLFININSLLTINNKSLFKDKSLNFKRQMFPRPEHLSIQINCERYKVSKLANDSTSLIKTQQDIPNDF